MSKFHPPKTVESLLTDRYFQPNEDWDALCNRVIKAASKIEPENQREEWEEKFYNLLNSGQGLPNSPALINLGANQKGCVAACFSFRPEDMMESILEVGRLAAMTLKFGGGAGFELSRLRPAGARIQSTHKAAMGPIGVMKYYNAIGDMITQGGVRKAALISILRIDHPDVIKFCWAKREDQTLANFNISVSITDGFMKKLAKESDKPHICHFNNKQYHILPSGEPILRAQRGSKKVLSIKEVYDVICEGAALNGDPGVFFVDHVNRNNPLIDGINDTENPFYMAGSNPCISGESKLCTSKGNIPIKKIFMENHEDLLIITPHGKREFSVVCKGEKEVVRVITDVAGIEIICTPDHLFQTVERVGPLDYKNTEWIEAKNLVGRDVRAAVLNGGKAQVVRVEPAGTEVVYDFSIIGETDFNRQCGWVNDLSTHNCSELPLSHAESCILGSIDLAKFVVDKELDTSELSAAFKTMTRFLDDMIDASAWPDPVIEERTKQTRRVGVGIMGFASMLDKLEIKYGSEECMKMIDIIGTIRETACSEESKQLAIERDVYPAAKENEKYRNITRLTIPPTGSLAMIANTSWSLEPHLYWAFEERRNDQYRIRYLPAVEEYIPAEELEELVDIANGDLGHLNDLIQAKLPSHMIMAKDITPEQHLEVVAAWQKYTDSSISKTICAPQEILTSQKVAEIYQSAWENKLKGITVYPEGSRKGEPMSLGKKKKKVIKSLPQSLKSDRHEFQVQLGNKMRKVFAFIGLDPITEKQPVEVFLKHPHVQDPMAIQFIDLTTRLLSLVLRHRTCPECNEEVIPFGKIIKQLRETDGQSMFSVPSIFVKALSKYLTSGESVGNCPTPGCNGELTMIEGCEKCLSCGFSSCN
jgi:ribonucleoside-diphosphate reductase alpha chain